MDAGGTFLSRSFSGLPLFSPAHPPTCHSSPAEDASSGWEGYELLHPCWLCSLLSPGTWQVLDTHFLTIASVLW